MLNIIPRAGGNTFSGSAFANGAKSWMQGDNYTQALKDQGLRTPSNLISLYDMDVMGGGRIVRDKLWFYLTYRQVVSNNTVPGMWVNRNADNPNSWAVDFDLAQPAYIDSLDRHGIARLTWQASPRNKLTAYWQEQYNYIGADGGGTPTQTPEATGLTLFQPSRIQQATWTSTITNRLLMEAGIGTYLGYYTQILKFGQVKRAIISADVYNLSNSDTVLAFNNSFVPGGAWLTPTRIAPARYMKVGAQFDF